VITLDATIPKVFSPLFTPSRYKVFYGGRGKGASWSFARALLVLMAQRGIRVLCAREYQASIRSSVHQLIADQIELLGMGAIFRVTRDQIRCANGGHFFFKGIRNNPAEIKSTEGIDIAWLAEAERTTDDSLDILIPTIRSEGSEIWIDFNPDDERAPTYKRFVLNSPDDAIVRKVTFRDNPFLPDTLRREMEYVRRVDPDKYDWVWEGNPRKLTEALVYGGRYRIEDFETPEDVDRFYYGADWGFSQDPSTMVRSFVVDRKLYIDHEAYGVGVELDDLPALFATVPGAMDWPSVADSARPETISYMQHHGYPKMRGASKPKGSVEDGIERIKEFEQIVVHPRCRHTIAELGSYSYKKDRVTGDILPVVEKRDDHCLDAVRYSHYSRVKRWVMV